MLCSAHFFQRHSFLLTFWVNFPERILNKTLLPIPQQEPSYQLSVLQTVQHLPLLILGGFLKDPALHRQTQETKEGE